MDVTEKQYVEHVGVLGMKWGVRKGLKKLGKKLKGNEKRNSRALRVMGEDAAKTALLVGGLNYVLTGNPRKAAKRAVGGALISIGLNTARVVSNRAVGDERF